jgi:hypothetical protein
VCATRRKQFGTDHYFEVTIDTQGDRTFRPNDDYRFRVDADNCPVTPNSDQADRDSDGLGDARQSPRVLEANATVDSEG